jgi:WD40 repeat protein
VNSLSLHPTFSLLASAGEDGVIKLWDAESGEFIKTLKGHTGSVQNLAFNEEGTRMISSSSDLTLKVWDAEQVRSKRGAKDGRLQRNDSKSILPPSSITDNLHFVASLLALRFAHRRTMRVSRHSGDTRTT